MDGSGPGGAAPQEPTREAELTQTLGQLREELRKAKDDHNMATGAISSLQRQLEIQGSQLQRITYEKEMLLRQLREREDQLQAMSDKFCSLTEEQRKEEMITKMEEENHSLQQAVAEQESQLAEQKQLISDLQETIFRLRVEVGTSRRHILEQERAQKELQSQAEALQHKELQTRVALECLSSKFERYRSKTIQAVFSGEGSQAPLAPLTDQELLEALQSTVNERTEFYRLLKQRGVKVPVHCSDPHAASPAKGKRKSPPRLEKLY